jgi:2-phosphosulfolactate phosphatase
VIDVAFTRADLRDADVAVVVDVLRATSTATQALAAGYRRVLCAETLYRARQLRRPGIVLAGERHCVKPAEFDQGNSPAEAAVQRGVELALATTNGAPTIVAATQHAPRVLLGCLLNLRAVCDAVGDDPERDVQIVCAGADGAAALEDVYVAGRISRGLPGERSDAALVAEAVARAYESPLLALAASADAIVLSEAGLISDIEFCARESVLDITPAVIAASNGVAAVAATVDVDATVTV